MEVKLYMSNLYERDLYLNTNCLFMFNKDIIEYDMSDAGFSLIKEFKLLPDSLISMLEHMEKHKRTIKIGKLQTTHKGLSEQLKNGFREARKRFFEMNNLQSEEIHSIKKDAVFTTRLCNVTQVGEYLYFKEKHKYTSFIYLKPLEIYYSPSEFSVKGISDDKVLLHDDGMNIILKTWFSHMESSSKEVTLRYLRGVIDKYKRREFPVSYYRTYDRESTFIVDTDLENIYNFYYEESKDDLNIVFNFFEILIRLVKITI